MNKKVWNLYDDLDLYYGSFDTPEDAREYMRSRKTFCLWSGCLMHYDIREEDEKDRSIYPQKNISVDSSPS